MATTDLDMSSLRWRRRPMLEAPNATGVVIRWELNVRRPAGWGGSHKWLVIGHVSLIREDWHAFAFGQYVAAHRNLDRMRSAVVRGVEAHVGCGVSPVSWQTGWGDES